MNIENNEIKFDEQQKLVYPQRIQELVQLVDTVENEDGDAENRILKTVHELEEAVNNFDDLDFNPAVAKTLNNVMKKLSYKNLRAQMKRTDLSAEKEELNQLIGELFTGKYLMRQSYDRVCFDYVTVASFSELKISHRILVSAKFDPEKTGEFSYEFKHYRTSGLNFDSRVSFRDIYRSTGYYLIGADEIGKIHDFISRIVEFNCNAWRNTFNG